MSGNSMNNMTVADASEDASVAIEEHVEAVKPVRYAVTYDALVLDAKLRQSLVTVRSLGRRGLSIAAAEVSNLVEHSPHIPTFSSRWCQHAYTVPMYEQDTEPFRSYLVRFLEHTGACVLMASSDRTLAVLREHREELERYTRVALAKESALAVAVDKE